MLIIYIIRSVKHLSDGRCSLIIFFIIISKFLFFFKETEK